MGVDWRILVGALVYVNLFIHTADREALNEISEPIAMYGRLFALLADLVAEYSGAPFPASAVIRVLSLLVDNGQEEIRLLESIHEDVKALVEGAISYGLGMARGCS